MADAQIGFEVVLFARVAASGHRGYGFFDNADPNLFLWRGTTPDPSKSYARKATLCRHIHTFHVVAQARPAAHWKYRGAFHRISAFSETPIDFGLVLSRKAGADRADLHMSVQEPLPMHLAYHHPIMPLRIPSHPRLRAMLTTMEVMADRPTFSPFYLEERPPNTDVALLACPAGHKPRFVTMARDDFHIWLDAEARPRVEIVSNSFAEKGLVN